MYPASEAFIAIADRGPGEGLRLIVDNGVFFEFVPTEELGASNPSRHWLGNAELGIEYAVVLSTCAGAWGYILGDTIKFVELDPPRILVTGRTSYVLSAFGEHLIGSRSRKPSRLPRMRSMRMSSTIALRRAFRRAPAGKQPIITSWSMPVVVRR